LLTPRLELAGWVAAGSPRIAYAGLRSPSPFTSPFSKALRRDRSRCHSRRIAGIVLGIAVMTVVFCYLWPEKKSPSYRLSLMRANHVGQHTNEAVKCASYPARHDGRRAYRPMIAPAPWKCRRRTAHPLPFRFHERGNLRGEEDVGIVAEHHLRERPVPSFDAGFSTSSWRIAGDRLAARHGIVDEADAFTLGLRFGDARLGFRLGLGEARVVLPFA